MSTAAMRHSLSPAVLGVAATLILPASPLLAQDALEDVSAAEVPAAASPGPELRGEALRAIAEGGDVGQAARRLARQADGLAADDLEQARTLRLAARLHWHDGDLEGTHRTLTRAGLVAYHAGEPTLAVRCFLDAARAAVEQGKERVAWRAAQRAGKVIHSANFSPGERARMLARVVYLDQPATLQTTEPLAGQ